MADFETEFTRRNSLSHALAMTPCLRDHFLGMRETAEASLIRHLPSLVPDDRSWVHESEIQALAGALNPESAQLTVALLDALCELGDRRVLRKVEALFMQVAESTKPEADELRAATYRCMVTLRERAVQTGYSQSLLRGSNQPATVLQSSLLRPAGDPAGTASSELLRPGEAEA
jgi:hypothetical protein